MKHFDNPDCKTCGGEGTVAADPMLAGWYNIFERTWRLPSGGTYTFEAGDGEMLIVVLCPACFPSHYPKAISIN